MLRKALIVLGILLLSLAVGVWGVSGQDGEQGPITTSAAEVVGVGSYVAGEAYAVAAGEDPAAEPLQAIILPYGIYPALHVNMIEDFQQPEPAVEGFTFEWSLTGPEGSAASLVQDGPVAIFQADVEGQYELTLTATDDAGNSGSTTWLVFATTYVGVGTVGETEPEFTQCGFCHEDQSVAWNETAHATVFIRAIDGLMEDVAIDESWLAYITTGYDARPEAENNGFDDRARAAGFTFPESLEVGNWDAMAAEFPEVAAMANVQCEACHGPGNMHVNATGTEEHPMISLGLSAGTCAQCHAAEQFPPIPQQWELSAHADKNAEAFWYPIGEDRAACVACHSGVGYIDAVSGVAMEERRTDYQIITCAVCHDPHDAENPEQLRVFDSVVLPDGTDVTGAGAAATCMTCHNARTDPVASVEGENLSLPHYSTAAELMNGVGGYTWGEDLPSSLHGRIVENTCIGCHMATFEELPGSEGAEGGEGEGEGEAMMEHFSTVGGHTFAMVSPVDGSENVAVCQDCHDDVESFAFEAQGDYDGDGAVETNQDEVAGLLELLQTALTESGVEVLDHHPYLTLPEDAGTDLKGAAYNFKFARDDAAASHNLQYTVALLQLSYEKATGEPVPNAELLTP